jgi:hypothetical protein
LTLLIREIIGFGKYEVLSFLPKGFRMSETPILIIGRAGKAGARVNGLLRASGVATRPVSRSTPVQVLGRPAPDFADYISRTAATGVWRA